MSFGGHVSGSPGRRSWHQERTCFEPVRESPNETRGFRVTAQGGWILSTTFKTQWFWSENLGIQYFSTNFNVFFVFAEDVISLRCLSSRARFC